MKKINYYNRLIVCDSVGVALAHELDIEKYVDGEYFEYSPGCVRIDGGYATNHFPDVVTEDDFEDIYEEDPNGEFEFEGMYDDEVKRYKKLDFDSCWIDNGYLRFVSEHGINTSEYDITDAEIVEVEVYKANNDIPQDYPNQCHVSFYKAVAEDGTVRYIEVTSPFFLDEQDYTCEEIDADKFDLYD